MTQFGNQVIEWSTRFSHVYLYKGRRRSKIRL